MPSAVRTTLAALSAALLAVLLYAQVLSHDFVDVDVAPYVTQNPAVLAGLTWEGAGWAFTRFHAANWHPLTWLSHMLDVELFGLAPAGHHAMNVAWHALASALVVLFLTRATGALAPSWFVGLAFAAHPLHAESVAWIAERKDVLSGALGLASLLAWTGWARGGSRRAWAAALVLFALGLLAKPMLVTLPFVLLLLDAWPFARAGRGWRALVVEKLPFFALSAASALLTVLAQRAGGAVQDLERLPFGARAANAAVSLVLYLRRAFWPDDLAFYYPRPAAGHSGLAVGLAVLVLAAIVFVVWREHARRPSLYVGFLLFAGMLVPVIGLVQVGGQALADRYMYLPLLGVLVAAAWTARDLVPWPAARQIGGVAAILALTAAGRVQIATWRDSETLARRALHVTADNHVAENLLGFVLGRRGDVEGALQHLEAALRIEPGDLEARDNLAVVLFQIGRVDEAEAHLLQVLAANPAMAKAREHLGALLLARGATLKAAEHLREAVRLGSASTGAQANLGDALERLGDREGARASFEAVLRRDARDLRALVGLARLAIEADRPADAAQFLERALELQPGNPQALQQRARLRVLSGDEAGAAEDLRASIAARPGWWLPRIDLAWLLASSTTPGVSDPARALALAEEVVARTERRHAGALDALALAHAALGQWLNAVGHADEAAERAREAGEEALAERIARRAAAYRRGSIDRSVPR